MLFASGKIPGRQQQATGRMVKSGYCTYPVVKLDIEKIGEYLEVA